MSITMYQYGDLPQIPPTVEEPQYSHWNEEAAYAQSSYRHESYYRYNVMQNDFTGQHTMKRFLNEPSPMTPNLLHATFERSMHNYQHVPSYAPWPAPELRYPSPDQTAVSESSSYVAPNESSSPYHQYQYRTDDSEQFTHPCIATDHMPLEPTGGSVNLRELQLEPEVPEPIEEVDSIVIKVEASFKPQPVTTNIGTPTENCRDFSEPRTDISMRDGESVQPMTPEEESSSDFEYTPGQSRRRRSTASNSNFSRNGQRRRIRPSKKTSPSTNANKVSKRSTRNPASSNIANTYISVQQNTHNTTHSHTHRQHSTDTQRQFPCPLSMYGCQSTFCSKNEWKRHVSTQHVKLGFWRCDLCKASVDPSDDQTSYYNDFNRKDLFTQHLRRMHMKPTGARRDDEKWPVTEDNIVENQKRCFMTLRETPRQSQCLFCPDTFQGPMSWELRMEHIGRHMERDRKDGIVLGDARDWIADPELETWLYLEGIITKNKDGQLEIGDGRSRRAATGSDE